MLDHLPRIIDHSPLSMEDWERRRKEIIALLREQVYGFPPPLLAPGQGRIIEKIEKCCAGHAVLETIEITIQTEKGPFQFPLRLFIPTAPGPHPLFLLLNFRPDPYDMYFPAEEIIDHGFALGVIYYQDVTSDKKDTWDKLAACFERPKDGTGYGAIALWAYAASRALDYLVTRPEIDQEHMGVIGHSRLGKTALWCGAQDERFRYVISNDSGCAGAALEKCKHEGAETTRNICGNFPYWFCENYQNYIDHPEKLPFDQHFLLAASAPRFVCVGSASLDLWADPYAEQLSCLAASPAWKALGKEGYIGPKGPSDVGSAHLTGSVGYQLRDGIHFLSRNDWLCYMAFAKKHW